MSEGVPELTVRDFAGAVAARTAAPGGGAVAAVTAGTSAALVAMAARFADSDLAELAGRADSLRHEALALADADIEAYQAVLDAYRRKDERDITTALGRATDVPLRIAGIGSEVATLAARLVAGGNPNLIGDARVAATLAKGAAIAAAALVRINVAAGGLDPQLTERADAYVERCGEPP
ncbi:cyclodeaminase/cyclohydrolase family protein [Amycolatopsis taiwanensis]|uniref:cyclodeaminase/cyclohydrolase family protein n=1 Tax=Amycolatopsis taiwanensis TaxID=342230 RepID=UPI0004B55BDA|nr:cyclodeaminase/cyclohydrolase family protein [Amycolatopsis taiwanensis]